MVPVSKAPRQLALCCEYEGYDFHGFQYQKNADTIQGQLLAAWKKLFAESLKLSCSSRTDAGVSARRHVSHCWTHAKIPVERLPLAMNTRLPASIRVRAAREMGGDFHARFHARGKHYCYRLRTGKIAAAIGRQVQSFVPGSLDLEAMQAAARALCGRKDQRALMDMPCEVKTTVRSMDALAVSQSGEAYQIDVLGDGFLYHQVRIVAGTLVAVGQGKLSLEQMKAAHEARDRLGMGMTMPAAGLCLERVYYQEELFGDDGQVAYDRLCQSLRQQGEMTA